MKKINQEGQTTLEFIFSFGFLLFFFLFFLTIGINLATGYVVHYAVFKASRSYLTYDNGNTREAVLTASNQRAKEVFQEFNKLGINGTFVINSPEDTTMPYEFVGARFLYSPSIKSIGPFGLEENYQLLSESFLGKEPSQAECRCQTQQMLGGDCNTDMNDDIEVTVFDNGC